MLVAKTFKGGEVKQATVGDTGISPLSLTCLPDGDAKKIFRIIYGEGHQLYRNESVNTRLSLNEMEKKLWKESKSVGMERIT